MDDTAPLIGRVAERAAIGAWLDGGVRLVTITGAGGVGKTRLASRLAAERVDEFAAHGGGGVRWCELAEARSAMAICAAVASALGTRLGPSTGEPRVIAALGAALARRRRVLIALDNAEHLVAEVAAVLTAWQSAAPQAQFLVTSRVALGLPEEQVWPLEGLADDAAALFLAHARRVRPALPLPPDEERAVAEIVRRLDGMPLAIQLAAARVRALAPSQILERLDRPLDLLVRPGDRGRHGSIRRTIADSVEALDAAARDAFAGCAVFRGGFTLDAAEAVLGEPGAPTWPAIDALCAASLLRVTAGDGGAARYGWPETIREVAAELLAADPARRDRCVARHVAHFAARVQRPFDELENIVAAHTAALAAGRGAETLALAVALDPLLATRGMLRLRLRLLDGALGITEDGPDVVAALIARAATTRELGDFERARADLDRAEALARGAGLASLRGLIGARIAELIEIGGDTAAAREQLRLSLAMLDGAEGEDAALVTTRAELHARLGHALRREGELGAAREHIGRATALYRAADHRAGVAAQTYEAGAIALYEGASVEARARFEESRAIAAALGDRQLDAANRAALGILAQAAGALDDAVAHHAAAVQVFRDLGNRHREGSALYYLAATYLERGEPAQALILLEQAGVAIASVGAVRYQALIGGARAVALHVLGDHRSAAVALDTARAAAAACASEPGLTAALAIHAATLGGGELDQVTAVAGDDAALARRLFEQARGGARRGPAFSVRAGGAAFQLPGAPDEVALPARSPLRRILDALARHRIDAPGEALAAADLVAAGWPDERIRHDAANNRLHVALATLRKLGLRDLLNTDEHGYLLDPAVAIEIGPDS